MLDVLKDKKVIFFDVGFTLDRPASGDWLFTNRFNEIAGPKLKDRSADEILQARSAGMHYLEANHLVPDEEAEYRQFIKYYSLISDSLHLDLSADEIDAIAADKTRNMDNYIAYPDALTVVKTLSATHTLGIISDTWPSIEKQLRKIGVFGYFSFYTFSCALGVFKPNPLMYTDALSKCGCRPEETVFIDDSVENLRGAELAGITPVLIAAKPSSDVETEYIKIHSLSELIGG